MIFTVLILIIVGVVTFFHYVQGFFSAFLSLIFAAIAAVVAIGFHEQVIDLLNQGKMSEYATAAVICALYATTYIILRAAFDAMVPGNVNFGSLPDKIGAGVCGFFASLFTAGVIAVAAQALPFGPSIGGYARAEVKTQKVSFSYVPDWAKVGRQEITDFLYLNDDMKNPRLEAVGSGLLIPADDFVLNFTSKVSAGSFSGDTTWASVHPSYADELFAQRLGIQPAAKRTAFPQNKASQVRVESVFKGKLKGYDQIDGDTKDFRSGKEDVPAKLLPSDNKTLVIVRVVLGRDAAESDSKIRFSLASFRIVAGGKNHYPVAVMRDDNTVLFHRADDFLIVDGDKGVDLVFEVEADTFFAKESETPESKVAPTVFIEFKRLSRESIAGKDVKPETAWEADPRTVGTLYRRLGWGKAGS